MLLKTDHYIQKMFGLPLLSAPEESTDKEPSSKPESEHDSGSDKPDEESHEGQTKEERAIIAANKREQERNDLEFWLMSNPAGADDE